MQDTIELNRISHHFDTTRERIELFHELSCLIRASETLAIVGPSGAGKSSLLSIAAGLEKPAGGTVRFIIDGAEVDALTMRANSGFIFQQFHLMAELDAIVTAIEQGDADQAARLSAEHVQKASQGVLRAMAEKAGPAS